MPEKYEVFIRNVAYNATQDDIRAFFERFVQVRSINMLSEKSGAHQGKFSGVAFVTFNSAEDMEKALDMDQDQMLGRTVSIIRTKQAQRRVQATILLRNLPDATTEADVRSALMMAGSFESVTVMESAGESPSAIVEMKHPSGVQAAAEIIEERGFLGNMDVQAISFAEGVPLSDAEASYADELIETLQEGNSGAVDTLRDFVGICGIEFAKRVLAETQKIEAEGGMMTANGQRRRTIGGVFLYLAKDQMPPTVRNIVFRDRSDEES